MKVIWILALLPCTAASGSPMLALTMPYKAKAVKPGNWSLQAEQKWSPGSSTHLRHRHPPVLRADSSWGCYGGAWPYFATQKDMWHTAWGDYLVMVYGELPWDEVFPLCMGDFWMFYDQLLKNAGVTDIPDFAGGCPPQGTIYDVDGQRIWRNNAYDPKNKGGDPGSVSWVWHPWGIGNPTVNNWPWYGANTPAEGGMSDNLWVEVTHKRDPWADESYGMWFLYARGSGIWLNLGKTLAFEGHLQAAQWLVGWGPGAAGDWPQCAGGFPDCLEHPGDLKLSKAIKEKGYDSVQFYHHHDVAQYGQCQGAYTDPQQKFDMSNMNIEIVSVGLVGTHSCGVYDDSHGALPGIGSGWYGQQWCGCNNQYGWTWCNGHGSQSEEPADWHQEDPLHYDAYPCAPGEIWATIDDISSSGREFSVGCACSGPFTLKDPNTGSLMCYQNPPDYYAVLAVQNMVNPQGEKFCSLQCSQDSDCGVDGQFCYIYPDGSATTCMWSLLPDGTCNVPGVDGIRVNAGRMIYDRQASQRHAANITDIIV